MRTGLHENCLDASEQAAVLLSVDVCTLCVQGYEEYRGPMDRVRKGVLVCMADGKASAYAMFDLQARGTLFTTEGDNVYGGMIVGESNTEGDLEVCAPHT